jgi:hypothetical protein
MAEGVLNQFMVALIESPARLASFVADFVGFSQAFQINLHCSC